MKQSKNNLDKIDKILYKYYKENKDIPPETVEMIKNTPQRKKNIKGKLSKVAILILVVSVLTTGVVFAKEIANLFKNLFGLYDIGINNQSAVSAIENEDYVQNTNMPYTKINEDYSIKIDYIMLDDINLYTVFNMYSEKGINSNNRISIPDLKIIADGKTIYDASSGMNYSIYISTGWNEIVQEENNSKRELLFLMSNGLPKIEKLEYKFSKIVIYNGDSPSDSRTEINSDKEIILDINIIEKFINGNILEFETENINDTYKIDKFISNNTGTYIVYKTKDPSIDFNLIYNDNIYVANKIALAIENEYYIFILQYNITKEDIRDKENLQLKDSLENDIEII